MNSGMAKQSNKQLFCRQGICLSSVSFRSERYVVSTATDWLCRAVGNGLSDFRLATERELLIVRRKRCTTHASFSVIAANKYSRLTSDTELSEDYFGAFTITVTFIGMIYHYINMCLRSFSIYFFLYDDTPNTIRQTISCELIEIWGITLCDLAFQHEGIENDD